MQQGWNAVAARQRLREIVAEQDAARGRPLTDAEKLANLSRAIARICVACGGEVEPNALCKCGRWNLNS